MFPKIKIDLKSNTVRNFVLGALGLAWAAWAGEIQWAAAALGAWQLLQNVHVRTRTVVAEDTLMEAIASLKDKMADLEEKVNITPEMAIRVLEQDGEVDA